MSIHERVREAQGTTTKIIFDVGKPKIKDQREAGEDIIHITTQLPPSHRKDEVRDIAAMGESSFAVVSMMVSEAMDRAEFGTREWDRATDDYNTFIAGAGQRAIQFFIRDGVEVDAVVDAINHRSQNMPSELVMGEA